MESAVFKYVDRNYKDSAVLIPGWAFDYRIFDGINLSFNYLFPVDFSPFSFQEGLLGALRKNNIKKITLLGWSLGGFVAAKFASQYSDIIDEIILISIRKRFGTEEITSTKDGLKKDKREFLHRFYIQCFSCRKEMHWFRENLLEDYCERFSLEYLLGTLEYLGQAVMKPAFLNGVKKITIVHGELDRIAPIQEALDIKNVLPSAKFIVVRDSGHLPFLKSGSIPAHD